MAGDFSVRIEARFEAAHNLRSYRGISEPLHGHSYKVEAELIAASARLDEDAIAVDFIASKLELERLAKKLDYGYINDVEPFTEINPSAENIAEWFCREMNAVLAGSGGVVKSITLWEGPSNSVTYIPRDQR
jgi:6-pyruvoyl-tetrahydropterin synthase